MVSHSVTLMTVMTIDIMIHYIQVVPLSQKQKCSHKVLNISVKCYDVGDSGEGMHVTVRY